MSITRSELEYSYKTDFQHWRKNQDFGRQNISLSCPPLDSMNIVMNTTNITTSPIDFIPIGEKTPEPTPRTRPTKFSTRPTESSTQPTNSSKQKGKAHVPADLESDPSLSDSSLRESYSLADSNYRKYKSKKLNTKKKNRKHQKQDLS